MYTYVQQKLLTGSDQSPKRDIISCSGYTIYIHQIQQFMLVKAETYMSLLKASFSVSQQFMRLIPKKSQIYQGINIQNSSIKEKLLYQKSIVTFYVFIVYYRLKHKFSQFEFSKKKMQCILYPICYLRYISNMCYFNIAHLGIGPIELVLYNC